MRFKVTRISKSTGYTGNYSYDTLKQAQREMHDEINDSSYAVSIWDTKKGEFALYQQA